MKKQGFLMIAQGTSSRQTSQDPLHTQAYGGEIAYLFFLLKRFHLKGHLLISHEESLESALQNTYQEKELSWDLFPFRQSDELIQNISLSASLSAIPSMVLSNQVPISQAVLKEPYLGEDFKGIDYIVLPTYLLNTYEGQKIIEVCLEFSRTYAIRLVMIGSSLSDNLEDQAFSLFRKVFPHLYILFLSAQEASQLFSKPISQVSHLSSLKSVKIPFLGISFLQEEVSFLVLGKECRLPSLPKTLKKNLEFSLLKEVFLASLLWSIEESCCRCDLSFSKASTLLSFAWKMVEVLPKEIQGDFDLPLEEDALSLWESPLWFQKLTKRELNFIDRFLKVIYPKNRSF